MTRFSVFAVGLLYLPCCLQVNGARHCPGENGDQNGELILQISDSKISTVAKVIASKDRRMLVIDKGGDFSAPCSYSWWMNHEVQGTVVCKESAQKSFLQTRGPLQECPICTPKVNDMVAANGYFKSMAALCTLTPDGQLRSADRVLIIGLGAGVLPTWLVTRTNSMVDVVDISDAVVKVSPCFGVQAGPRLAMHVADGRHFLSTTEVSYNSIVVDAFDNAAMMPPCLRSVEFFQLVAQRLTKDGVLLLNLLKCGTEQDVSSCGSFQNSVIASVQQVFSKTYLAQASGSSGSQSVLVAKKQEASQDEVLGVPPDDVQAWFKTAAVEEIGKIRNADAFRDSDQHAC